ncbi:hypothetical protein K493DRAFT_313557 [Basidiobolus meristosporus CBS 931.73]|uniref:Uncharacterized protein n=1 Tax=Basidiobolus meristosporus CBS 931.73 TaxID=1314790 RepID=A0A1Y1YM16_9FUNG|nr:hypothetical protein K493DRAFT_313557 [Basidiobolus meristosporus CBS 931.73]|eukprot:ORX98624.1 hypothetical protein K493DRAFT_313557 [Basidiobolus meristosporus CBS 931.73]
MFTLGYRHVTSIVRLKAGNGHRMFNYINLLQELMPGQFNTEFPLLIRIQIKTAKNSESPWYHFEGTGANGVVTLTIGDFRPKSFYVRQFPLDSLLGRSFGRGKTDTFYVAVGGLFRRSQIRAFSLAYDKKGYGTSRWVIDEVKIELDQELIYQQQKLKAVLDEASNKFEAEF